jgi:hypothetical protein
MSSWRVKQIRDAGAVRGPWRSRLRTERSQRALRARFRTDARPAVKACSTTSGHDQQPPSRREKPDGFYCGQPYAAAHHHWPDRWRPGSGSNWRRAGIDERRGKRVNHCDDELLAVVTNVAGGVAVGWVQLRAEVDE